MSQSYTEQILESRNEERRVSRSWLQCYLAQTPPTFEYCKAHFKKKGMSLSRTDYEDICKKMFKEPQYEEKAPESKASGA